MPREAVFYVKWGQTKALELRVSGDTLTIRAANMEIRMEPRSLELRGKYTYKREVEDQSRKTLYIGFGEKLQPVEAPRIDILGSAYVGNFEVRYTDLDFEKYLTVITPANYLYDYAVVTTRELMLHMSPRRKVYYEEEPYDHLIVYLV